MNRKISIIILAMMMVVTLIGCNSADKNDNAAAPTQSVDNEATQAPDADSSDDTGLKVSDPGVYPIVETKVELDYFCGGLKKNIEDMATNKMTQWYEEFTNVHINWEVPPAGEEATKLNLSLASGDYPDVYWSTSLSTAQTILYANSGVIIPLNDLIEKHGFYLKQSFEVRPATLDKITAPDGNIYSLYRMDEGLHGAVQQKMFVYQPWLDQLGIEAPTTTQEFADMLQAFMDNDMNKNGDADDEIPLIGYANTGSANIGWFLMNPFILTSENSMLLNIEDSKIVPAYTQEGWKEGILYIRDLYERGLIAKDSFTQDANQLKALANRPDEPIVGASPALYELTFSSLDGLPDTLSLYESIKPLVGPSGLQQTPYYDRSITLDTYITSACEYPEVALKWNDYWFSEEGGYTNGWGFEGEQHEWVDELSILGKSPSLKSTYKSQVMQNDWWGGSGPRFQTSDMRYSQTNVEGALEPELYKEAQNYLPYIPDEYMPGILWLTEQQANDLSALEANIWGYVNEMFTQFITGTQDVEAAWDDYLADLENIGLDEYLELYQEIYDQQ